MKHFETTLEYLSGDGIPGDVVDTVCSRCGAKVIRNMGLDMLDPSKADLKIIGNVLSDGRWIDLKWIHVCRKCQDKFMAFMETFLKKRGKTKSASSSSNTCKEKRQRPLNKLSKEPLRLVQSVVGNLAEIAKKEKHGRK